MGKIKTGGSWLEYRDTPWDARVFGFRTREIMQIGSTNARDLIKLLEKFDKSNRANNVKFTYTRISADDKTLKKALQENGFYYAETSLKLEAPNIQKYNYENSSLVKLRAPKENEYGRIRALAEKAFVYGRFHEDFNIAGKKAGKRFYLWIDDLKKQGKKFLVCAVKNRVKSFLAYSENGKTWSWFWRGATRKQGICPCISGGVSWIISSARASGRFRRPFRRRTCR